MSGCSSSTATEESAPASEKEPIIEENETSTSSGEWIDHEQEDGTIVYTKKTEYGDPFDGLDENTKVLPLPGGGMLFGSGEAKLYDENGNLLEVYDPETDPDSITVKEARERLKDNG